MKIKNAIFATISVFSCYIYGEAVKGGKRETESI